MTCNKVNLGRVRQMFLLSTVHIYRDGRGCMLYCNHQCDNSKLEMDGAELPLFTKSFSLILCEKFFYPFFLLVLFDHFSFKRFFFFWVKLTSALEAYSFRFTQAPNLDFLNFFYFNKQQQCELQLKCDHFIDHNVEIRAYNLM